MTTNETKTAGTAQLDPDAQTNSAYVATPTIPDASAEPEGNMEGLRDYADLPPNLAENDTLCATVLDKMREYFTKFKDQAARKQLETDMKSADRMLRVSKTRNRTSATGQQEDTLSNVASTSFYKAIRIITAGQKAMMFYGDSLPVKYEEITGSPDFPNDAEAKRIASEQNLLLRYTFDADKWENKIKDALWWINKYGQLPVGIEWEFITENRIERVPVEFDEQGRPIAFEFQERRRVIKDFPVLDCYDLKDFYFDAYIKDIQEQKCILIRAQKGIEYLYDKQRDGEYMNVGQVTDDQMFTNEDKTNSDILSNRQEDAGETPESQETGNIEIWTAWIRVPINEKGKWDPKNTVPTWYQCVIAGNLDDSPVCLMLRKNPYHHAQLPFKMIYSHLDDKGAIRMGYATLLECLYEEETSTINELIDNKTLRTRKPWIAEKGNLISRNLKFRQGNQVFWVKAGTSNTAIKEITVQDTTQTTLLHLQDIRRDFNETAGTDKAMAGQFAGARTTSTEYQGVMNQAMKPAIEDAEFVSDQFLPWLAEITAYLWRQLGDPARVLQVCENGQTIAIKPTHLYGEFKTKVVSIGQFESDVLRRQEENNFIAVAYPFVAPLMGRKGQMEFWKDVMVHRKLQNIERYFPDISNRDAERLAWYENILIFEKGEETLPEMTDDHDVHIPIISSQLDNYKLLPPEEQDPNRVRIGTLHLMMHRQMKEQLANQLQSAAMNQQGMMQAASGGPSAGPVNTGEVAGDMLGGIGGAEAI